MSFITIQDGSSILKDFDFKLFNEILQYSLFILLLFIHCLCLCIRQRNKNRKGKYIVQPETEPIYVEMKKVESYSKNLPVLKSITK